MDRLDILMTLDDQTRLRELVRECPDDAVILEYGMGGSTLLMAEELRATQRLISIDHNPEWYHKVKTAIVDTGHAHHVSLFLKTPDLEPQFWPFGHPHEETPVACFDYIHAGGVPVPWSTLSMVFVDGFVRGPVLAAIRTKLPSGIPVLLHDYKGREEWYDWAVGLYQVTHTPTGGSEDRRPGGPVLPNSLLVMRS